LQACNVIDGARQAITDYTTQQHQTQKRGLGSGWGAQMAGRRAAALAVRQFKAQVLHIHKGAGGNPGFV